MKVFFFFFLKNLFLTTIFIAFTLAIVVFLTQSLRFLELVINAGATSSSFWILTLLALPRFFEIILPLALMASTVFIYNRMSMDSELVVMRSAGASPLGLAKPALILAVFITMILWVMTMWAVPKSGAGMQQMRQVIKAQFSALLFREGVFNSVMPGLTVYMRERTPAGEMRGLMIHDTREENKNPATILARRGVVVATDSGHKVMVYDGSRQEYDPKYDSLRRLHFERYTIDLPDSGPVLTRWREPDERTIIELLNPDLNNARDVTSLRDFSVEIHRRFVGPLFALVFTLISLNALLLGPMDRRGQGKRIILAIAIVTLIQGLFLAAFNLSRHDNMGLVCMYALVFIPLALNFFFLTGASEKFRRKLLYKPAAKTTDGAA